MKKSILLVGILVFATLFMSFKKTKLYSYGGTASAYVETKKPSNYLDAAKLLPLGTKAGDTRVLEVSIICRYSSKAAAQEALLSEINIALDANLEKLTSRVEYYITDCE